MNGAAAVRGRFRKGRATGYEERRAHRPFWAKEHAAVKDMLSDLPRGSRVLDIPVGTGRYATIYQEFGFVAVGIDVSSDMLAVAREKVDSIGYEMELREGDVLGIDAADGSYDTVVCTRLLNWISPDEMATALFEMMRVCAKRLIVSIELGQRRPKKENQPQTPESFSAALKAIGGAVEKRVGISDGYWMVQVGRRA